MTTLELLAIPGTNTSKRIMRAAMVSREQSAARAERLTHTRVILGRKGKRRETTR